MIKNIGACSELMYFCDQSVENEMVHHSSLSVAQLVCVRGFIYLTVSPSDFSKISKITSKIEFLGFFRQKCDCGHFQYIISNPQMKISNWIFWNRFLTSNKIQNIISKIILNIWRTFSKPTNKTLKFDLMSTHSTKTIWSVMLTCNHGRFVVQV